jgi:hypothetical protein
MLGIIHLPSQPGNSRGVLFQGLKGVALKSADTTRAEASAVISAPRQNRFVK